jgi:hypothetical protein
MAKTTVEERLAEFDRRHRELTAQIADVGIVAAGSVTRRYTRCTSVGCRCNADPPTPHGPYWQWTAKVNGKTVTKRLTAKEAQLYEEWIGNDRRIKTLLNQIRKVDAKATELLLKEAVSG